MDKNKFKELVNSNIDITNDKFVISAKEILAVNNPKLKGSYLKYGKDKACDLDMNDNLHTHSLNERNEIIETYINKLLKHKNKFKVIKIKVYIKDERVQNIIDSIGFVNGLLEVIDFDITNIKIDDTLPDKIKVKITELLNKYDNDKTIDNYVLLNNYLVDLNYLDWSFEEFIKKEKLMNGIKINLNDRFYTDIYIEIIYDNFIVSNLIQFIGLSDNNNIVHTYKLFDLNDMTVNNKISYYNLLKKIQHFIKWAYWQRLLKEKEIIRNTIFIYNQIDEFREKIGNQYNEICLLNTSSLIAKTEKEQNKLKEEYYKKYEIFNLLAKEKYEKVSKIYSSYLALYLRTK